MIRFDNLPPEVIQAMCTPMHQILPGNMAEASSQLWLGSLSAAHDSDLLRQEHISHVVQVLDMPYMPEVASPGKGGKSHLEKYRVDIMDTPREDLAKHLDEACAWISDALRHGGNVLVHCGQVRHLYLFYFPF